MASSKPGYAKAGTPAHRAGSGGKGTAAAKTVRASGKVNNSTGTSGRAMGGKSVPFSTGGPTGGAGKGRTSKTSSARKVTAPVKLQTPASARTKGTGTKNNLSAIARNAPARGRSATAGKTIRRAQ
jgi:hypothetical protein